MIYKFYYDDDSFLMEINERPKRVCELLDEYRKIDEDYNADGWEEFLGEKGYTIKYLEAEEEIYF